MQAALRVFIIHDDLVAREELRGQLLTEGCEVSCLADRTELSSQLTFPPDVLLLDAEIADAQSLLMQVRGCSGCENVTIVGVSYDVIADELHRELARFGADNQLSGPIRRDRLAACVAAAAQSPYRRQPQPQPADSAQQSQRGPFDASPSPSHAVAQPQREAATESPSPPCCAVAQPQHEARAASPPPSHAVAQPQSEVATESPPPSHVVARVKLKRTTKGDAVPPSSSQRPPPSDGVGPSSSRQPPPSDGVGPSSSRQPPPSDPGVPSSPRQPAHHDSRASAGSRQPPPRDSAPASSRHPPHDSRAPASSRQPPPHDSRAPGSTPGSPRHAQAAQPSSPRQAPAGASAARRQLQGMEDKEARKQAVADSAMAALLERARVSKRPEGAPAAQPEGMSGEHAEVYDTLHSRLLWLREQPDHERLGLAPGADHALVDEAFKTLRDKYRPRRYRHHGGVEVQRVLSEINELLASSQQRMMRATPAPGGGSQARSAAGNPMFAPTPAVISELVKKAQRFHARGLEALDGGRARDARNLFQQALALAPDRMYLSDLELAKGTAAEEEGDVEAARKHFTNALRAKRDSQRARDALQALSNRERGLLGRLFKR